MPRDRAPTIVGRAPTIVGRARRDHRSISWGSASCGGSRAGAGPVVALPLVPVMPTGPPMAAGSSISPSTGATGAGRSSAARTEGPAMSRSSSPTVHEPAGPFSLPATTHAYLARAAESLGEAMGAVDVPTRYACAHVAALRAAAALLAARARPAPSRRRPQKNAWVLLTEVAPELAEWASFFAAGAAKRAAAEAGSTRAVTEREADDLVRDADRFLGVVEQALGLAPHRPAPQLCVTPVSAHPATTSTGSARRRAG